MLDRLISGAGALTDGADRSVRALSGGSRSGFASTRPGSLVVVALLVVLTGLLILAGLEATDPSTPVALAPTDVASSRTLADRTYSTIHGALSATYAEYFSDDNANGVEDAGEAVLTWYYWLVDRDARAGVTVRSSRPPESLFTFHGSGVLIDEPAYARESFDPYDDDAQRAGLSIEAGVVVDTTNASAAVPAVLDLAGTLPPTGTTVELSGARLGSYIGVCRHDPSVDSSCPSDQQDLFEVLVFDRASRHAIRVLVRDLPEFTDDADLTGLLRREERAVDDARSGAQTDFDALDLTVSDRYVLDEAVAGGTAPLTFALAGLVAALAGVILIGWAGGYLIYRRTERGLPVPATSLGAGERIPLRITGILRTPTGLEHVREAPGALIRFVLGRPVTTSHAVDDAAAEPAGTDHSGETGAPVAVLPVVEPPIATTLIVERTDTPQGIAVGSGELTRLSSGQVMTLRAPRPALRVVAATGPVFLSFDTEAERDRAAAELLVESGLGRDGTSPPTASPPTASPPTASPPTS
jgi:hypothetical protein